jgi:hypothetical protein
MPLSVLGAYFSLKFCPAHAESIGTFGEDAMVITDYHVQGVLRTYTQQLQRSSLPDETDADRSLTVQAVRISEEAKQRLLMDRIRSQALEHVSQHGDGESP